MRYHLASLGLLASSLASGVLGGVLSGPHTRRDDDDGDNDDTPLPLVIWHGLGDNYANEGLRSVGALAEAVHPGTLVYYVQLGESASADRTATFFGNVTEQLEAVCAALAAHPILSTAPAVDALGFSQGGQFLRGYVERCNAPPVRSLVTFGSQHNGIVDYRTCGAADLLCRGAMALLHSNTFGAYLQGHLVPAQYFRDPADLAPYREASNFLADVNNERPHKNPRYADHVAALAHLALYMFEDDTTVIPKQTAWFDDVDGDTVTPLRARALYKEDWLGLQRLDRRGGLHSRTTPGDHLQLSDEVLTDAFKAYFGPYNRTFSRETESAPIGEL